VLIFLSKVIAISYVLLLPAVYSIYHVFNHIFGKLKFKHDFKKKEKAIFYYLGLLGIIFIIIPIPLVMFLDLLPLVRSLLFGLPLLGLWFILEYVEHSQHKRSLLMDLLEFREGKLIAIVITSLLLGLLIEGLNNIAPAWSYKNIPFASVGIFGIPIIILLGWIPLIVIFLSFYRVFIKENDHIF
jgi:hypothetical protein